MIKSLYLYVLLTVTLLSPCAAQLKPMLSMDDARHALMQSPADGKKAELLTELALDYVLKQGEFATDLDSALLLLKQATRLNENVQDKHLAARIDFVYANALRESGKTAAGKAYIEKALALYDTVHDPEATGMAWFEMANYYSDKVEEIGRKRDCFEKAMISFRAAGDKENEAFALKNMGDCSLVLDNDTLAARQLLEALAIYRSIGYQDLQGVYDLLGIVSSWMGDYSDAVKYGLEALRTAEARQDTSLQLCTIYNRLGVAYSNWGDWDTSILYWKKAMDIAIKYNNTYAMRSVMLNLCRELSRRGQWGDAIRYAQLTKAALKGPGDRLDSTYLDIAFLETYTRAGQFDKAKQYADELKSIMKNHPDAARHSDLVFAVLARYYMASRQYAQAKENALTYLSIELADNQKKNIARAYELMSSVDSAQGNYKGALADFRNYKKVTDSMLNETTSFQFAEQQVEYNTEQKDKDILVLKQQDEIEKGRLTQTRILGMVGAVGIIVLAVLLGLLYNRYRVKQRLNGELKDRQQLISEKSNAMEALLNEKVWLVKEMHHRVKNNLQIVISLQNSQAAFMKDEAAIAAIRESQHRVQAISLLHRKLYQSENTTAIDMPSYISEVVNYLAENVDGGRKIQFVVSVHPLTLDVSQAVPVGLIINEAVTNSIKYAFPGEKKGLVQVALENVDAGYLELIVSDNGEGLPEGFDSHDLTSLGLSLMKGLSKQLDGEFGQVDRNGVTVKVRFKPAKTFTWDRFVPETNELSV